MASAEMNTVCIRNGRKYYATIPGIHKENAVMTYYEGAHYDVSKLFEIMVNQLTYTPSHNFANIKREKAKIKQMLEACKVVDND